jgi:2-keto-3-deoxy-6-phosphogluconate aldolase
VSSPDSNAFVERLARERLIAILRARDADRFVAVASALYDAGWRGIEVTLTTEGALAAIEGIRDALPEDAWVGAGNVPAYLEAGALGVGLGGPLLGDALSPAGDLAALTGRAADVVAGVAASLAPAGGAR